MLRYNLRQSHHTGILHVYVSLISLESLADFDRLLIDFRLQTFRFLASRHAADADVDNQQSTAEVVDEIESPALLKPHDCRFTVLK